MIFGMSLETLPSERTAIGSFVPPNEGYSNTCRNVPIVAGPLDRRIWNPAAVPTANNRPDGFQRLGYAAVHGGQAMAG